MFLGKLRHEDCKFKGSLGYIVKAYLKTTMKVIQAVYTRNTTPRVRCWTTYTQGRWCHLGQLTLSQGAMVGSLVEASERTLRVFTSSGQHDAELLWALWTPSNMNWYSSGTLPDSQKFSFKVN